MPLRDEKLTCFGVPRYSGTGASEPPAVILGVPSSLGAPFPGCSNGPFFIRRLSQRHVWQCDRPRILDLRSRATRFDDVCDAGDLVADGDAQALHGELFDFIAGLPAASVPIVIGGDHSITLPVVSAVSARRSKPLKLIVFDHHLDFQYWSKVREPPFHTNVMSHVSDLLGSGQIVHIGVEPIQTVSEDLWDWYLEYLDQAGAQIPLLSDSLSNNDSIMATVGHDQDIYISIDVDVLGRDEMLSTGYPSEVGLPLVRMIELIRLVSTRNRVVGCDLVEFSASRDDRRSATLADAGRAASLLLELLTVVVSRRDALRDFPGDLPRDGEGSDLA